MDQADCASRRFRYAMQRGKCSIMKTKLSVKVGEDKNGHLMRVQVERVQKRLGFLNGRQILLRCGGAKDLVLTDTIKLAPMHSTVLCFEFTERRPAIFTNGLALSQHNVIK